MARIAMQEHHRHLHCGSELHVDRIADAETQPFAVEPPALLEVGSCHHHMSKTLRAGDETGNRPRRMERILEFYRRAVKGLAGEPIRIRKLYELGHAPHLGVLGRSRCDLHTKIAQPLGYLAEAGGISDLPSGVRDVIRV